MGPASAASMVSLLTQWLLIRTIRRRRLSRWRTSAWSVTCSRCCRSWRSNSVEGHSTSEASLAGTKKGRIAPLLYFCLAPLRFRRVVAYSLSVRQRSHENEEQGYGPPRFSCAADRCWPAARLIRVATTHAPHSRP